MHPISTFDLGWQLEILFPIALLPGSTIVYSCFKMAVVLYYSVLRGPRVTALLYYSILNKPPLSGMYNNVLFC